MNEKKPIPPFVWYLIWIGATLSSATGHWIYPPIVFAFGAVLLYNSPHGQPLHNIVKAVQQRQQVDLKRAQQLAFGLGLGLVLLSIPVVRALDHQAQVKQDQEVQRQIAVEQQRRDAANAEREAQEAKAAAAKAEQQRLQAQAEATRAQEEAARAKAAREAQQKRDAEAKQEAAVREKQRQDREKASQAAEAQRQADEERRQQEAAQKQADDEAARRAAEGPYTEDQAEKLCKQKVAGMYDVQPNAVIQKGSYVEIMDHPPRNMEFGGGRVWNWEPTFSIAGTDILMSIQCTVFESGEVRISDQ